MSTSVVKIGTKKCKPFSLQVMVYSPESGYKFEVDVEKACTAENDPIWKLVFDLYKKQATGNDFDQIVHVSFKAGSDAEQQGIKKIVQQGVSKPQAQQIVNEVYPKAKALEAVPQPTPEQKKALHEAMSKAVTAVDV